MMNKAGYSTLKEMYGLPDIPHHVTSYIVSGARKTVDDKEYYPPKYAPENTLAGHLEFARMSEYLYSVVDDTIDQELKTELETVLAFTQARKAIDAVFDLPEKQKNLFLKICWQGHGQISKIKRQSHFGMFTNDEIEEMQRLVAPYFAVPSVEER